MKKVALLTHGIGTGGAEHVVARLTEILSDKCDLRLILFDAGLMEYDVHCPVIDMRSFAASSKAERILLPFKRACILRKIKKENGLDCVISFLESPNIVNILSKTKQCKTVVSIRNYYKLENSGGLVKKIIFKAAKAMYNKADYVIPVTKVIAENYRRIYEIDEKKLKVIYNPYDAEKIKKQSKEDIDTKGESFFADGFIICTMGRFSYQKGYWHLIKAIYLAKRKKNALKVCFIGAGEMEGDMRRLISDLGMDDAVFFTGRQSNPYKYIARSDMYVLSSLYEGFPNAMAEAMICGCPVIAADCKSGPREILFSAPRLSAVCTEAAEADYGIIVPPLESAANWDASEFTEGEKILAEAIVKYADNPGKLYEISQKAQGRIEDFSYNACAEKYMEIINS